MYCLFLFNVLLFILHFLGGIFKTVLIIVCFLIFIVLCNFLLAIYFQFYSYECLTWEGCSWPLFFVVLQYLCCFDHCTWWRPRFGVERHCTSSLWNKELISFSGGLGAVLAILALFFIFIRIHVENIYRDRTPLFHYSDQWKLIWCI